MAAMTTALTEFSDSGDSRTYTLSGHTASSPKLVIQKRRVPAGNQTVAEVTVEALAATVDSNSVLVPQKIGMKASIRYPINGTYADVSSLLATFRDIVAGDEFAAAISSQNWLK